MYFALVGRGEFYDFIISPLLFFIFLKHEQVASWQAGESQACFSPLRARATASGNIPLLSESMISRISCNAAQASFPVSPGPQLHAPAHGFGHESVPTAAPAPAASMMTVHVPRRIIGRIIGAGGQNVRALEEWTKAKVLRKYLMEMQTLLSVCACTDTFLILSPSSEIPKIDVEKSSEEFVPVYLKGTSEAVAAAQAGIAKKVSEFLEQEARFHSRIGSHFGETRAHGGGCGGGGILDPAVSSELPGQSRCFARQQHDGLERAKLMGESALCQGNGMPGEGMDVDW
jgi:hypothetical protein